MKYYEDKVKDKAILFERSYKEQLKYEIEKLQTLIDMYTSELSIINYLEEKEDERISISSKP